MTIHDKLDRWLKEDIEVGQSEASALLPTLQRAVLIECLRRVTQQAEPELQTNKLLSIAQSLLSGVYPHFSNKEALSWLAELTTFAVQHSDSDIRASALTVSALLCNRIRNVSAAMSDRTRAELGAMFMAPHSEREMRVASALTDRIQNSEKLSYEGRSGKRNYKMLELDISSAAKNINRDIEGDWYQDPWGWPEIEWLALKQFSRVMSRLKDGSSGWTVPIDVAKQGGGNGSSGSSVREFDTDASCSVVTLH